MVRVRRSPNESCFNCGRQYPIRAVKDWWGDHIRYSCPDCHDELLCGFVAQDGQIADAPSGVAGPEVVDSEALRSEPRWTTYEVYYTKLICVAMMNGRRILGSEKAQDYVEHVIETTETNGD